MSQAAEIGNGLRAALLLARGRSDGLELIAAEPACEMQSTRRSFWAALLCLPAFVALHLLDWRQDGVPPHATTGFAMDLMSYAIGWAGFALLSRSVAVQLGRGARWPRFVAIWNWCNVIQYLMLVVAALPGLLGLPDAVTETAWLVAMGWALWLEWSAARLALEVPGLTAAGLVAMDVCLGLFLVGLTATYTVPPG